MFKQCYQTPPVAQPVLSSGPLDESLSDVRPSSWKLQWCHAPIEGTRNGWCQAQVCPLLRFSVECFAHTSNMKVSTSSWMSSWLIAAPASSLVFNSMSKKALLFLGPWSDSLSDPSLTCSALSLITFKTQTTWKTRKQTEILGQSLSAIFSIKRFTTLTQEIGVNLIVSYIFIMYLRYVVWIYCSNVLFENIIVIIL